MDIEMKPVRQSWPVVILNQDELQNILDLVDEAICSDSDRKEGYWDVDSGCAKLALFNGNQVKLKAKTLTLLRKTAKDIENDIYTVASEIILTPWIKDYQDYIEVESRPMLGDYNQKDEVAREYADEVVKLVKDALTKAYNKGVIYGSKRKNRPKQKSKASK